MHEKTLGNAGDETRQTGATAGAELIVARWGLIVGVTLAAIAVGTYFRSLPTTPPSDFAQVYYGAHVLWRGQNPYDAVGPGRVFDWAMPLLYPLPAVVLALPLIALPLQVANLIMVGAGAAGLAWLFTSRPSDPRLLVFTSIAYLNALQACQWSPLLTTATAVPALGLLFAVKPTIGAALWIAYPSGRALAVAAVFTAAVTAVWPWWIRAWWDVLAAGSEYISAPILRPGGALMLAALARWRLPEARLLIALACVPHAPFLYEAVPLFLIPQTGPQAVTLAGLTLAVWIAVMQGVPYGSDVAYAAASGQWMVWFLYLPCLIMVLARSNHATAQQRSPA